MAEPVDLAAFRADLSGDLALFSRLTSGEPDRALIEWMRMSGYPQGMGLSLRLENAESAVRTLAKAVDALPPVGCREGREALSTDYQAIFLSHARPGLATESHWVGDDRSPLVGAWYDRYGYLVKDRLNRPHDSLAFELGFMAHLFDAAEIEDEIALSESQRFLMVHLLSWSPDFFEEWAMASITPFYRGLAGLLGVYLHDLNDQLRQVQGDILSVPS